MRKGHDDFPSGMDGWRRDVTGQGLLPELSLFQLCPSCVAETCDKPFPGAFSFSRGTQWEQEVCLQALRPGAQGLQAVLTLIQSRKGVVNEDPAHTHSHSHTHSHVQSHTI